MEIRTALDRAKADKVEIDQQIEHFVSLRNKLETEIRGLEYALEREAEAPIAEQVRIIGSGAVGGGWVTLTRTAAVLRMLGQHREPVSPRELSRLLTAVGRSGDTPDAVGAALSYLGGKGDVKNEGYGQWVLADKSEETAEERLDLAT